MKAFSVIVFLVSVLTFLGCQESKKPYVMGEKNPNSLILKAQENAKQRENLIELKKLETQANVEIAKIQSAKDIEVAQIDSKTKQNVALTTSSVTKEQTKTNFYIAIALGVVLLIALLLWYLNNKKSRELQAKMHEQKLQNEAMLKVQEMENDRINKLLELYEKGVLPEELQEDLIQTAIGSTKKTIEYKKDK
jgi:flagellar biosynthesis/type III secretory pathway M-ring protein FliF/YscJ